MYAVFYSVVTCWTSVYSLFYTFKKPPTQDPFPIIILLEDTSLQVSRSIELLDTILHDLRAILLDPKTPQWKRKTLLNRRHFQILRRKEYIETKERVAELLQCLQERVSDEMVVSIMENATQTLKRLNLVNIDSTINQMEDLFENLTVVDFDQKFDSMSVDYPSVPTTELTIKKDIQNFNPIATLV